MSERNHVRSNDLIKHCAPLVLIVVSSLALRTPSAAADEFPTFEPPHHYPLGNVLRGATLGDFNGDGHIDIATVDFQGVELWILWNDGNGEFPRATPITVAPGLSDVEAADLDGDGDLDLIVLSQQQFAAHVLMSDGAGVFSSAAVIAVGDQPVDIEIGDFDNDGDTDAAIAIILMNGIAILRNDNGVMTHAGLVPAGGVWPRRIAIADFDMDGWADLFVALSASNHIAFHRNDRSGGFDEPVPYLVGNVGAGSLQAGDLDGDGDVDLVAVDGGTVYSILRQVGPGPLFTRDPISTAPQGVGPGLLVDLNDDGHLDYVSSRGPDPFGLGFRPGIAIVPGAPPPATLASALDLSTGGTSMGVIDATDLAAVLNSWGELPSNGGADLNGDGVVDGRDLASLLARWGVIDGPSEQFMPSINAASIRAADLDGDGDLDLVVVGLTQSGVYVFKNQLR